MMNSTIDHKNDLVGCDRTEDRAGAAAGGKDEAPAILQALQKSRFHLDQALGGLTGTLAEAAGGRRLFEAVFDGAPEGIILLERGTGVIRRANRAAGMVLGLAPEALTGQALADLAPEEDRAAARALGAGGDHAAQDGPVRLTWRRQDGAAVPLDAWVRELPGAERELLAVHVRDVAAEAAAQEEGKRQNELLQDRVAERTEQAHRAERALEEATLQNSLLEREARQAAAAKDRFFAAMSTELRTPLNAVIGMTDLLLDMEMGREQQQTADVIAANARTLLRLIDDVLDFSNIQAGKLTLENSAFHLPEILAAVLDTFSLQARQKGLGLELDLRPEVPEHLVGDPVRLRQILINLVGNAVRFTETGGVKVRVAYEKDPEGKIELRVRVQDTGPGIAKERQQDIFTAFSPVEEGGEDRRGRLGLGLNIARQLVEMMNGTMGVESKPDAGSTFWFTARFDRPAPEQILELENRVKAVPAEGADGIPQDLRVLLVEDNPVNQRVALGMLGNLGLEGRSADDGPQALDMLAQEKFDLVFMDIIIPEMSGLEVTRRVRDEEAGSLNVRTPIVAMTAHATRQDRQLCLDAGMNGYLAKPVSSEKLRDTILQVLATQQDGTPPAAAVDDFALDHAVSALDHGATPARQAVAEYVQDSGRRLKVIIGALQSYDFNFAAREMQVIEDGAQGLKAEGIVALTGDLQQAIKAKRQDRALEVAESIREALTGLAAQP